jgi:hypothetical protein
VKEFRKVRPDQNEDTAQNMSADDWRLERLINRAPRRIRSTIQSLRQPSRRWLRIPAGLLLTAGGVLWFLPIAGLWMLPIGLVLLAEDVPPLRSLRRRTLDWIERRRPDWLADRSRSH